MKEKCKGYECNGGLEIIGFGDNQNGQITGNYKHGKIFKFPVIINFFSGKNVRGVITY